MHELDDAALELRLRRVLTDRLGSLTLEVTAEGLERRRLVRDAARGRRRVLVGLGLAAALVLPAGWLAAGAPLPKPPVPPVALQTPGPTDEAAPTAAPTPVPTPVASPAVSPIASPSAPARSDRLAVIHEGSKHCGNVVTTIDVGTGASDDPSGGCFVRVGISPDGTHATTVVNDSGINDPADPTAVYTVVDLRDHTTVAVEGDFGWSPRGRWQVIQRDRDLFSIRSADRPVADATGWVDLPRLVGTAGLSWSPDELHLGFRTADGFVIGDGGGTDLHVLDGIPWIWSWSEDGSRIAFPHTDAYDQVWVGNSDGTDQVQVSDGAGAAGTVELSADGRGIAVLSDGHVLRWRLSDGTWRELELGVNLDTREPRVQWTPAGDAIVVSARNDPDGHGGPGITFLISVDGTVLARVDGSNPTWSPDGRRFAVSVSPADLDPQSTTALTPKARGTTYIVARDGTTVRVKDAYAPAWSPDGRSLAVITGEPASSGIAVISADGTGRRAVPRTTFRSPNLLTWVP